METLPTATAHVLGFWDHVLGALGAGADVAAVITGIVAVWAWLRLKGDDRRRVTQLEDYLKHKKRAGGLYQHSAVHLSGKLGMTEAQVFQAATTSENIGKVLGQDEQGFANRILFEYAPKA